MSDKPSDRLRVIIVGGSIAGLTLAHCLELNPNIEYVLLEAADDIHPEVGASIVVLPSGARILDQLGIFDEVTKVLEPLIRSLTWNGKGQCLVDSEGPALMQARCGYEMAFLTRRNLLKVLYNTIKDKSKVLTSKRVLDVVHSESGVTVTCKDGSSYEGDIVVGADGIHSTIRVLMQDRIELNRPGTAKKDKDGISSEYSCIFGMGGRPKGCGLRTGDTHRTYTKDYSTLSFIGDDTLFWFLFSKMDKRYYGKDIPRFSKEQMEEAVKHFNNIPMTDGINYDKVWEHRTFAMMVSLEESQNETWTLDRMVCIGDSIHKMTPNLGAGGNAAIESAAALANHIAKLSTKPTLDEIRKALGDFYTKRHLKVNLTCDVANNLTRIEALDTLPNKLLALYGLPYLGDLLADMTCDIIMGAERVESLPLPPKSLQASMEWNQESGIGKKESYLKRALWALPLLGVTYVCQKTMWQTIGNLTPLAAQAGSVNLGNGIITSLVAKFTGISAIDGILSKLVALFTPAISGLDQVGRLQGIAFLADLIPVQTIWLIESIRRGNLATTSLFLPTFLSAAYQLKGIGFIAPIYYFLHYIQSPLANYAAPDNRLTSISSAKVIIPTIAISYIAPSIAMFVAPGLSNRQWINGLLWQPFPIYASLIHQVLKRTVKDTTEQDKINNPTADMKYLRAAYGFSTAIAAAAYLYVRFASPVSLTEVFFKGISNPSEALPLITGAAKVFRYDQICAFTAGAMWVLLSFKDLKAAKKIETGWDRILGTYLGTTLIAGPGAGMSMMWAWREECLAKRRVVQVEEVKK